MSDERFILIVQSRKYRTIGYVGHVKMRNDKAQGFEVIKDREFALRFTSFDRAERASDSLDRTYGTTTFIRRVAT